MTMARYSGVVTDQAGNIITNAKIEVRREIPGAPLAALKSDRDGLVGIGNPFNANADGSFGFHAIGGAYKVRAYVGPSGAPTFEDIRRYTPVGLLQEYDLDAILIGQRQQVRVATTANITISTALNNGDTLDGVTLATSDLVLVKDQTSKAENGVYVVGVSPARSAEFDTYNEHAGAMVAVVEGTAGEGSVWFCTANSGGTLGTTAIDFTELAATAGPAGPEGPQGPAGPVTVAVGAVTTLAAGEDATVTNSGDDENVILDFGIPAGEQGIQGEQGLQGEQGIQGAAGADGADGQNFEPDEVVALIADRDAFDGEVKNFAVLVESDSTNGDLPTLYFKLSASSGDWSGGFTFGGGGGGIESVVAGSNITVDNTDPANPIISADGGGDAADIAFDNSASGLAATNVQDAIDEIIAGAEDYGLITSSATATDDYGSIV